ncbi:hypothetical protein CHGG_07420 [Chaetomium globosum CBS 148.51]|uniref:Uncharacterized protein n=1 Tax=Chaetomium globosum (strain ATCC 6205 / CBS 148.51 / DSM 1962 / NBRC 6347 / NRRL 1970) TaxID=306901 RepID=Q2GX84_CHAGB|nr:uncharacterized protein CHGG_07420 [Chaetomium globosum CBS 148.51]EAQ86167.1 hypothetical protein CHGG_07420 [Chaetomium globosum CBS 148.51]
MTKVHHLMALLSFSRTFAPTLGHVNRDYGYGGPILLQSTVTATITTTQISTVTVDGSTCDAVYTPTTVTVYTGCSSISDASGLPLSSYSSHGPWINATFTTDVPCTHNLPTSIAAPSNFSSSMGWNHTTVTSLPTLSGTAGTTIETADPLGTSSVRWTNSTRSSTAEEDWTSVITLTVTSSAMVPVNATTTTGYSAPSSGFSTGTGIPGHESSDVPLSYHPSLTYQTTTRATTPAATTAATATRPHPRPPPPAAPWTWYLGSCGRGKYEMFSESNVTLVLKAKTLRSINGKMVKRVGSHQRLVTGGGGPGLERLPFI